MKCANCGAEINGTESFCGKCGTKVEVQKENNQVQNNQHTNEQSNKIVIEIVLSILFSLISYFLFAWLSFAGIVAGVYALKEIKETNAEGKTVAKVFAYIGIILGCISILIFLAAAVLRVTSAM